MTIEQIINLLPDYDNPDWDRRQDDLKCDVEFAKEQLTLLAAKAKDVNLLLETINKESVVVTSGPDTEFSDRSRILISGDNHDMESLHNFLLEN